MGVATRVMLASVIIDAKRNFFIQSSWEIPKWESIFKHSLAGGSVKHIAAESRGEEDCNTTASGAVMDGL
jgi:hypothetical protein